MIAALSAALHRWWRGWEREHDSFDNLRASVVTFLLQSGLGRRAHQVGAALLRHPAYPRLSAALEVLAEHGIAVRALRSRTELLERVPSPGLITLKDRRGMVRLSLLSRVYHRDVLILDTQKGWRKVPRVELASIATGVVVSGTVEIEPRGKPLRNHRATQAHQPLLLLTTGALLIATLTATTQPSIALGLATVGLCLAALLVSAGSLSRFCPHAAGADCASVLGSPVGRLFGGFSLSEVGLGYFLGCLTVLWLAAARGQSAMVAALLGALALAAVPITLLLIFYQLHRLRAWCPLCLGVHAVVWAQALGFERGAYTGFGYGAWACTATGFGLAALAMAVVAPGVRTAARLEKLEPSFTRLRRRPSVVRALLDESPVLELPEPATGALLGRREAIWRLDLFLTSGCRRCEENLRAARTLLEMHPQTLAVATHPVEKAAAWLEQHQIHGVAPMFLNGRQAPEYLEPTDLHQLLKNPASTNPKARSNSGLF